MTRPKGAIGCLQVLIILTLVVSVAGCGDAALKTSQKNPANEMPHVIRVGMSLKQAEAVLQAHGAKETMFQIALTRESWREGYDLHYYKMPNGPNVQIISITGEGGRLVSSIAVSTYKPKSLQSKQDPEYDKFHSSFQERKEYDLRAGSGEW